MAFLAGDAAAFSRAAQGRGNSYGVKALKKWMDDDPIGTKYALECDIYHCFEELDPAYVINALKRLFKDRETLWLCDAMMEYGVLIGALCGIMTCKAA